FEAAWRRWLHDGVVPNTAFGARNVSMSSSSMTAVASGAPAAANQGFEVVFRNDPCVLDGRFANNGWLQELPKPITKLTWDNAVLVSPKTAELLNVGGYPSMQGGEHGQIISDEVELRYRGRSVKRAQVVVAGH